MNREAHARAFIQEGMPKGVRTWADKHYSYDFTTEDGMLYLQWFDDNAKKTPAQKVTEARAAYRTRFGMEANVVLVSEGEALLTIPGCEVKAERRVGPSNYQVGRTE